MKFNVSRLIIWFEPVDEPQVLSFYPNKVNVITGNSSTGKSNIIAIINYCLLSEKSNIVEPVINQFSKWYGLEFNANGETYAIARKRPDLETITSDVYIQKGKFEDGFYPSSTNYQIQGGRKYLNSVLGYHNEGKEFRFRSNFIFNMLTENIITSPYDYLNINFFDTKYFGKSEFREMLVDNVITPKGLNTEELKSEQKKLGAEIKKHDNQKRRLQNVQDVVESCIALLKGNGFDVSDINGKNLNEQVALLRKRVEMAKVAVSKNEEESDNDIDQIKRSLMEDSIYLHNLVSAKAQYEQYLGTLDKMQDALKPIEYLQRMKENGIFTMWTDYIMRSLGKALSQIVEERKQNVLDTFKFEEQIAEVKRKITEKQELIKQSSVLKQAVYQQAQSYRAIGVVEEKLSHLDMKEEPKDKVYSIDDYDVRVKRFEELATLIDEKEQADYKKWQKLEDEFQCIYDNFNYMEFYEGCKTKYNRECQRLQLRGRDEGYDYDVVGSQSNYMFMHLCFFLGLHRYLIDYVDSNVFQFLFIDQPSIPYYVGNAEVNSNDEDKLKDAFRVINDFMDYVVNSKKEDFQVILVEHAPKSYWEGENGFSYFKTCHQFLDGEALIPSRIIKKYTKND